MPSRPWTEAVSTGHFLLQIIVILSKMSIKELLRFLMMVLFALESVRHCCIMIITIIFGFILELMDSYNAVKNYFVINVKFHFFLTFSLFATCSVFSSSALKMCKFQTNGLYSGLTKTAISLPFLTCIFPKLIISLHWGEEMVLSIFS